MRLLRVPKFPRQTRFSPPAVDLVFFLQKMFYYANSALFPHRLMPLKRSILVKKFFHLGEFKTVSVKTLCLPVWKFHTNYTNSLKIFYKGNFLFFPQLKVLPEGN